jgi:hypothetical protein
MPGMIRLDPHVPMLWRSPSCVQVGVDPRLVVLDDLSIADEHVLAALVDGATRASLEATASATGGSPEAVAGLLARLRPVLTQTTRIRPQRLLVDGGRSPAAARIMTLLSAAGRPAELAANPERQRDRVVLLVADHALEPARSSRWLAVDARHLPVVFGDQAITVGPLVLPGLTPCIRCTDEYRIDADPAWPTLAAELLGREPSATTSDAGCLLQTAGVVARLLEHLTSGEATGLESASIRIDAVTGAVSRRTWTWHDRCACRRASLLSPPSTRPRTATRDVPRIATAGPTTAAADDVPA